jgi:hypothetical protein
MQHSPGDGAGRNDDDRDQYRHSEFDSALHATQPSMLAKPARWFASGRHTIVAPEATHLRWRPMGIIIFNHFHPIFEFVFSTPNLQTV